MIRRTATLIIFAAALTVPASAGMIILDSMSADDWNIYHPTTAMIPTNTLKDGPEEGVLIDFDLEHGDWVAIGIKKEAGFGLLDASHGDALSFWMKGGGHSNSLVIEALDASGNKNTRKFPAVTGVGEWRHYVVPFSVLSPVEEHDNLNTSRISQLGFAVVPDEGKNGSIAIDKISSYRLNTPASFMVSSFDYGSGFNETGGEMGPMSDDGNDDPSASFDAENAYSGAYCLKLEYNAQVAAGGWGVGYWIHLSNETETDPADASGYTHLTFMVNSDEAGRNFKIEIDYGAAALFVVLTDVDGMGDGTSTEWQEVSIPLGAGGFGLSVNDMESLKEISIVIDPAVHPSSGTLYFDSIRFTADAAVPEFKSRIFDYMNLPVQISGWKNYGRDEEEGLTATSLDTVPGVIEGRAIRLNYSFNRNIADHYDWVIMTRDWGVNLSTAAKLGFSYRGTGDSANLELKVIDKNGTKFWRKFFSATDTGGVWKQALIPLKELTFFEAGTVDGHVFMALDLTKISGFEFAVSGSEGASGRVEIRDLAAYFESSFSTERAGKLIESVQVTRNPFSPNNDGLNDTTSFVLSLAAEAEVSLRIFSLNGGLVYEKNAGLLIAGAEHSIEWDGRSSSNSTVPNRMYFYNIDAEGGGRSDSFSHVIGVMR